MSLTPVVDVALEAKAAHQIVHAVQAAEHRALAAARRSDERRNAFFLMRMLVSRTAFERAVVKLRDIAIGNSIQAMPEGGRLRVRVDEQNQG